MRKRVSHHRFFPDARGKLMISVTQSIYRSGVIGSLIIRHSSLVPLELGVLTKVFVRNVSDSIALSLLISVTDSKYLYDLDESEGSDRAALIHELLVISTELREKKSHQKLSHLRSLLYRCAADLVSSKHVSSLRLDNKRVILIPSLAI